MNRWPDLGQRDADYIRGIIRLHRTLEFGGRAMMPLGFIPPFLLAGMTSWGSPRSWRTWRSATT